MSDINLLTYIIVCTTTFLGGFVDAIAGGGGLISIPGYMIAGLPAHYAIATNKLSASMGTAVATFKLARLGHIPWKRAFFCIIAAVVGGSTGARLALLVSADLFKRIMLVIIPLTAVYLSMNRSMGEEKEPLGKTQTIIRAVIIAMVVGVYDGFYGPGTGTFLILLLMGAAHFSLGDANGTAKAINLTTAISSLIVYLLNGKVIIMLGLAGGITGIAGNYIGVTYFEKKGVKIVRPVMFIVLAIFFIRIISEL